MTSGPAAMFVKRDSAKRATGTSRTASRFRGVTHHSRTNVRWTGPRYESHVWSEGRQVYLGGYTLEVQAATAYDLAAVKFRGSDAQTNFELGQYTWELEDESTTREAVVAALRGQSKAMNSVVHDPGVDLADWELEISAAVHADKRHLGVFADERAAARAVDRALVSRLGLEAATSFPLVEYVDLLDEQAVAQG
ncbi:hypothetical protein H632_c2140p0, partial [Helicosporidium sp. ATCC 50920]